MTSLLTVLLFGAAAMTPHGDQPPTQRFQPGMEVYYPGGKAPARVYKSVFGLAGATSWYVFTGKTLCEAQTVSSERPSTAGNGWRIDLKAGAPGSNTLQVTWERLWADNKPSSGGGTRTLTLGSGSPLVLDSIDGGSRLRYQERIDQIKKASPDTVIQQNATGDLPAVDGCDALSMRLQITAETIPVTEPTETELWLVHRDPSGQETTQRQVVRAASGSGSFVFDDILVKTEHGPITVEVYGAVGVQTGRGTGGQPWLILNVNRRYVAGSTAFGWKTKEGGTSFGQDIRPDEVVGFQLLPMKDDEGVLVGHRFSLRVRTRILK